MGVYYLTFSRNNMNYTSIPSLKVIITSDICKLDIFPNYFLPILGYTLPIYFNFSNCIPAESIDISFSLQPNEPGIFLTKTKEFIPQTSLLIGLSYIVGSKFSNLTVGQIYNLSFSIIGSAAYMYSVT